MASSFWSALVLRWPHPVRARRGRRFWGLASSAAVAASAALVAALDGLSTPSAPRGPLPMTGRLPGFAAARSGFLSRSDLFSLHLTRDGARVVPECGLQRCRPIELRLVGAREGTRPVPEDPLPLSAPARGRLLASSRRLFASVIYEDIYPGIAMRFRGHGDELSYFFLVDRGASPDSIVLELTGVDRIEPAPDGGLVASRDGGAFLRLSPPSARQADVIDVRYVVGRDHRVALHVRDYDVRRPLAIWGGKADLACPHR